MNKKKLFWQLYFLAIPVAFVYGWFKSWAPFAWLTLTPIVIIAAVYIPVVIYTKLVLNGIIKRKNKGSS